MIRRLISKTAGKKKIFTVSLYFSNDLDMTINEFEDQIEAKVTDSRRLLQEAMQLESYLFSPKV
jgi:DICT domain-containing protein